MKDASPELVSARSVRALDAAARAIGIDLDVASLAPSLLQPNGNELIPLAEKIAYCRALLCGKSETLGLDIAKNLPLEVTGFWSFLLRSSPTYGDMLRRAERYIRIVNKFPEFMLAERGEHIVLVSSYPMDSPFGNRPQAVMSTLTHWISWGRELTEVNFATAKACFTWSGPHNRQPFDDFFGCPVTFGANEDALFLSKEIAALPLRESAPELAEQFEAMAAMLISSMTPASNFLAKVRSAIADELLAGTGQAEQVAKRLAMGSRTLHRRLAEHGFTFRKLRDELLRARAERLMRQGDISLSEVSYLLGFSEPANFNRACRRRYYTCRTE